MAKYVLTKRAVDDLSGIWEYTFDVWSENQADKYYQHLIETCNQIAKNHSLGKSFKELGKEIFGYSTNKHILFYRIINPMEIEVVRILHVKMELKSKLDE